LRRNKGQMQPKQVYVGDLLIEVYSLQFLAAKLHRRPASIKFWEWKKIIPKPLLRVKDGRRWYTKEEVELYVRLAEEEQIMNGKSFEKTKFTVRAFGELSILERKLAEETNNAHIKKA
jgi:hypothetical protein